LRILILSTPKTGNTWLRALLSAVYDIPELDLPWPFDPDYASARDEWVSHHHYRPDTEIVRWIETTRPVLITTIRHPGDVLLSLYHHVHAFQDAPIEMAALRAMLHTGFERTGVIPARGDEPFSSELACSIEWIATGLGHVVRYEDLRRDTFQTLTALTDKIAPVNSEAIDRAIDRSELGLMRVLAGVHGKFFRAGRIGDWRHVLTPEILGDFAAEPYRSQLAQLGYTLDPRDPIIAAPVHRRVSTNRFAGVNRFDNGVLVAPILVKCFLSCGPELYGNWPDVAATGPGSFYDWLNTAHDCASAPDGPRITNLAAFIYRDRVDLPLAFPDLWGRDRVGFARWFFPRAGEEHGLDPVFTDPMRRAFLEWAGAPAAIDPAPARFTLITRYLWRVYQADERLQRHYPDPTGADRAELIYWFLRHAPHLEFEEETLQALQASVSEGGLGISRVESFDTGVPFVPVLVRVYSSYPADVQATWMPVWKTEREGSFMAWLNAPCKLAGEGIYADLAISNLAHFIYGERPDVRESFPDLRGGDRVGFVSWFLQHGRTEYGLAADFTAPLERGMHSWACAPVRERRRSPAIGHYILHLYNARADLQQAFPNVFGGDAHALLGWFRSNSAILNDPLLNLVLRNDTGGRTTPGSPALSSHPKH
jgi:hypothetical protein